VESAGRLDTNVYTYPRYREYVGNDKDVVSQETAAQLGVRRYSTDAEWQAHRKRVLDALEGAKKAQMRDILDRVEQGYAEAQRELEKLSAGGGENARTFAANTLYGMSLKRIIELRENFANAKTEAERSRIAQQIRDTQAKALYFASEAYLTEAAINHIVFNTQMAGRKITAESLLSGKIEKLELPMTTNEARQSLFEQLGYLLHQYSHYQGYEKNPEKAVKLAGKLSKYFLRMLDAAHLSGVDLRPIEKLVELTVKVEKDRGNTEKLAELLPGEKAAEFARDVRKAMEWLTGEVYRKAPVSIVQPRKQPPPQPKAKAISTEPTGGRSAAGETHRARGAGSGPPGGQKDDKSNHEPANTQGKWHKVVDSNGDQNGWVYRDPNGQTWFQPLGMPGTPLPPPQKVQLSRGGGVVTPYRKIGKAVPTNAKPSGAGPKAAQPANRSGGAARGNKRRQTARRGVTGSAATGKAGYGATGPAKKKTAASTNGQRAASSSQPATEPEKTSTETRGADAGERPVVDSDGNVLGWVETDPNGQKWLRPNVPDGVMTTPPQKVEVTADGSVVLGGRKIGKLGPKVRKRAAGKHREPAESARGRPVRDAQGSTIGHLQKGPTSKIWFAPEVPPGVLATPPVGVEVLGNGQVILGGRIIGYAQPEKGERQMAQTTLPKGEKIELVVRVVQGGKPKVAIAPDTAPATRVPAPALPQLVFPGMPAAPAAPKSEIPRETQGAGFEGLWLGWHGSVTRNIREGQTLRAVIVKAPPEVLKSGWKIGDTFYEGVVKDGKLTGTAFVPLSLRPGCNPKFAKPRFEAWLVDEGEAIKSRIEVLGPGKGCEFVHTGRWAPLFKATRIHDDKMKQGSTGQPPYPGSPQGKGAQVPDRAERPGQMPEPQGLPSMPGNPVTIPAVPSFGAGPLAIMPPRPQPDQTRVFELPPIPAGTRPEDRALIETAARLLSETKPECVLTLGPLYVTTTTFIYDLNYSQYHERLRKELKQSEQDAKTNGPVPWEMPRPPEMVGKMSRAKAREALEEMIKTVQSCVNR